MCVRAEKAGKGDAAGNGVSWWRDAGVERDVQLTAAGSWHQDQETEKGIVYQLLCIGLVPVNGWENIFIICMLIEHLFGFI